MKRVFHFLCIAVFSVSLSAQEKPEDLTPGIRAGWETIRPMDPYFYCKTLASSEFAGRHTGHEGFTKAAKWAAGKFAEWGLKPAGDKGGYLQAYASPYSIVHKGEMTVFLKEKKENSKEMEIKELKPELIKDFMPLLFCDSGSKRGGLVFAGWGIHAPELGYDDFAGIDVKDRFILCFRGVPDGGADKRFQHHDEHRTRMKTAKDLGALGLIYIYAEVNAHPNGDRIEGFLPAMISETFADSLFAFRGVKSADVKKALRTYQKPLSFEIPAEVELRVEAEFHPDGTGYNIAGYVEGMDPELKSECLVIGGHFDGQGPHLGRIFPGANDNASGSAVVMEIAEAFAKAERPRRSVMFVLFGGEEMGLMGSTYFADHMPAPFKKVDLMINFDMEGEGDAAVASYSAAEEDVKKLLEKADQYVGKLARLWPMRGVGVRGSDFAPFYAKGFPCASFFSNGPHLSYHQPGDTIYRINPDIMADIARIGFLTAFFRADR